MREFIPFLSMSPTVLLTISHHKRKEYPWSLDFMDTPQQVCFDGATLNIAGALAVADEGKAWLWQGQVYPS